jgi:hypothetical protein
MALVEDGDAVAAQGATEDVGADARDRSSGSSITPVIVVVDDRAAILAVGEVVAQGAVDDRQSL